MRPARQRVGWASPQRGSTLIEVLVALVVFSLGLIGMAMLHGRAAQYATNAEDRNRAALMADDLVAQMWLAQSTAVSTAVVQAWQTRLADLSVSGLPHATGSLGAADGDGLRTITITWYPVGNQGASTVDAEHPYAYVTKVVLP
jgi:type IV pilus assembly protein PilV